MPSKGPLSSMKLLLNGGESKIDPEVRRKRNIILLRLSY